MSTDITADPTQRLLCGADPDDTFIIAAVARRTYRVVAGRCVPDPEQLPLTVAPEFDDAGLLIADTDCFPFKPATDVVVLGSGYAPSSGLTGFTVGLQLGKLEYRLAVHGDRRCHLDRSGRLRIGDPDPIDSLPLTYARAYGGRDRIAEAEWENPMAHFLQFLPPGIDPDAWTPYCYPRNPCGQGYLIEATQDAVDALRMPNLEDPDRPIAEADLVVGSTGAWLDAPIPRGMGWFDHRWFPRIAYFGSMPPHEPREGESPEALLGLAEPDLLADVPGVQLTNHRAANGASLGLQIPYLRGDERGTLVNAHPSRQPWCFALPGERPRISVDDRKGGLTKTKPRLHSVILEPEEDRISLVWCGSGPGRRLYMPDELEKMPFEVRW